MTVYVVSMVHPKGGSAVFSTHEKAMAFIENENRAMRVTDLKLVQKKSEDYSVYSEWVKTFSNTYEILWGIQKTEIDLYVKEVQS